MNEFYKIFICGFTGAGKSTLLCKLALNSKKSGCHFIDLDEAIVLEEGKEIAEIVNESGWEKFRALELNLIKKMAKQEKRMVMALGGGAFTEESYHFIREQEGKILWVDTSFETSLQRIKGDHKRPLATLPDSELLNIYKKRSAIYERADKKMSDLQGRELVNIHDLLFFLDEK